MEKMRTEMGKRKAGNAMKKKKIMMRKTRKKDKDEDGKIVGDEE